MPKWKESIKGKDDISDILYKVGGSRTSIFEWMIPWFILLKNCILRTSTELQGVYKNCGKKNSAINKIIKTS